MEYLDLLVKNAQNWNTTGTSLFPKIKTHHNFQNSHGYAPPYAPPPRRNLEETLHAFIEKKKTISTQLAQNMTNLKMFLQNSHLLLVFKRKVSFHLNHSKIQKGNTMQMQVVLEVNTWIKSN